MQLCLFSVKRVSTWGNVNEPVSTLTLPLPPNDSCPLLLPTKPSTLQKKSSEVSAATVTITLSMFAARQRLICLKIMWALFYLCAYSVLIFCTLLSCWTECIRVKQQQHTHTHTLIMVCMNQKHKKSTYYPSTLFRARWSLTAIIILVLAVYSTNRVSKVKIAFLCQSSKNAVEWCR